MNQKIKIGYQISKPIITTEECELYSSMVEELSNHNAAAKPGEELWTVKEQEDCYEVVSDGTVPSEEQSLEPIKNNKISESKTALSAYLASHPLQWSDGKYYSVTSEKQALLTSNLALYQISASAGQPFKLTWNSTGDECVEWTYEELAALALAIGTYVQCISSRSGNSRFRCNCRSTYIDRAYLGSNDHGIIGYCSLERRCQSISAYAERREPVIRITTV